MKWPAVLSGTISELLWRGTTTSWSSINKPTANCITGRCFLSLVRNCTLHPLITLTFHTHTHTHCTHPVQRYALLSCTATRRKGTACNLLPLQSRIIHLVLLLVEPHKSVRPSVRPSLRPMIVGDIKITRHLWPHFVEAGTKIHCWRSPYFVTLYFPEICNLNMVTGQTYEVLTTQGPRTINY